MTTNASERKLAARQVILGLFAVVLSLGLSASIAFAGLPTGTNTVSLQQSSQSVPDVCTVQNRAGTIDSTDPSFSRPSGNFPQGGTCTATTGSYEYDVYEFQLAAPANVTADTCDPATTLDTYLVIYQAPDGSQNAFNPAAPCTNAITGNDDTPGCGLKSRVQANLVAGFYYVVVTTFSSTGTGPYNLRVTECTGGETATPFPTFTPTITRTPTDTRTPTNTVTGTPPTATITRTPTLTRTPTEVLSTATVIGTGTSTAVATGTATQMVTMTGTVVATGTAGTSTVQPSTTRTGTVGTSTVIPSMTGTAGTSTVQPSTTRTGTAGTSTVMPSMTGTVGTSTVQPSTTRTATAGTSTVIPSTTRTGTATQMATMTGTAVTTGTATQIVTMTRTAVATTTRTAVATGTVGTTATPCSGRVTICHRTGNGGSHTITVSCNALPAHLRHGDTVGACPAGTPRPRGNQFRDVTNEGEYFYAPVYDLRDAGAVTGYADNTFRPFNTATRSQFVKIVVLAFRIPLYTGNEQTFSDVPRDNTFYVYVETAQRNGLVGGYADGTFRPYANVTRGQVAKVAVEAARLEDMSNGTQSFSDVPVGSTFYNYIETAYANGILSGYADGTFRPNNDATRGQVSKIVDLATDLTNH